MTYLRFVTSNVHKFHEAERILKEFNIIIQHADIPYQEIRAERLEDIAADSALRLKMRLPPPYFVEDTGLFIEALNGFPGPFSGWVLKKIGLEGILKLMKGRGERRAIFRTAVALFNGKEVRVFVGEVYGTITNEIKGRSGFGYDPIFVPEGYGKTFAELGERKNTISHRRKALEKMVGYVRGVE